MKKTPSYLKGLAETRARAAGEVARYEKIASDISDRLKKARDALAASSETPSPKPCSGKRRGP